MIAIHDLRHTHATLLRADREPVKMASERLHASIMVTLAVELRGQGAGAALALLSVDGMIVAASKTARFPPAGTSGPGTAVTSGGADGQAIWLGRGAGHV